MFTQRILQLKTEPSNYAETRHNNKKKKEDDRLKIVADSYRSIQLSRHHKAACTVWKNYLSNSIS